MEKEIKATISNLINSGLPHTIENIRKMVEIAFQITRMSNTMPEPPSENEINVAITEVEMRLGVKQNEGVLIVDIATFQEWYNDAKKNIEQYYFNRYTAYLDQIGRLPIVISNMDHDTTKIVGHLENPHKPGPWTRRGMVVGHVQAGKTENFLGVVNKAFDCGYKLIIVAAGLKEILRVQTQERVDYGIIGKSSTSGVKTPYIGVGTIDCRRTPFPVTNIDNDFQRNQAQLLFQIANYAEPTILVVKKNATVLENLKNWLAQGTQLQNQNISELPMLFVDDEADNASINTNKPDEDPTTINRQIRSILQLFNRNSYLAYTATPFANVFINPEKDDIYGDDLFPRDFILILEPPSNYLGPNKIFSNQTQCFDIVRSIEDAEDVLPLKHKIDQDLISLPLSLRKAIYGHIIGITMRLLKNQLNQHHSMLIHISRFKSIQNKFKKLIVELMFNITNAINLNYLLSPMEALRNSHVFELQKVWIDEYQNIDNSIDWEKVQHNLADAVNDLQVRAINGESPDNLNYKAYPNGLNVIAIGGEKLSRGFTLEGLLTSYFYRNTSMYDTLMQMGRWFGYRVGYEALCRIYMTEQTESYFKHITDVAEELRHEFIQMHQLNKTPCEFGLKIRLHPESLLITARNKMRTAKTVRVSIDLNCRLIETAKLSLEENIPAINFKAGQSLIEAIGNKNFKMDDRYNHVAKNVSVKHILVFLNTFINHCASAITERAPICKYIEQISSSHPLWDVVAISKASEIKTNGNHEMFGGLNIGLQRRKCYETQATRDYPSFFSITDNRKVSSGSGIIEATGLDPAVIKELVGNEGQGNIQNISGILFRKRRKNPLLMLHLILPKEKPNVPTGLPAFLAYGISFPDTAVTIEPVEYACNTIFIKEQSSNLNPIDGGIDDED